MKKFLFMMFVAVAPLSLTVLAGCKSDKADGYDFVTKDFMAALQAINADDFLEAGAAIPGAEKDHEIIPPHLIDVKRAEYEALWSLSERKSEAYRKVGDGFCSSVSDAYVAMVGDGISGRSAYAFDEELLRAMRAIGAFPVPLRFVKGNVSARYFNPNSVQAVLSRADSRPAPITHGGNKEFAEFYSSKTRLSGPPLQYEDKGFISFQSKIGSMYGFLNVSQAHDLMLGDPWKFSLQSFSFDREFIVPVFYDLNNLGAEKILMYVNFPFVVTGDEFGKISTVVLPQAGQVQIHEPQHKMKCSIISKTGLWDAGMRSRKKFIDRSEGLAMVGSYEPLTWPLDDEYRSRVDGRFRANAYEINPQSIVDPSLKCWMSVFGYGDADPAMCLSENYAVEFLTLLKSNICVGYNYVDRRPRYNTDIYVNPRSAIGNPESFNNICQSNPVTKSK
ncbi:hypothetical protein [Micavibrio aeruginosavorus]|nr:hypothetical protein [Micavibrio aeruginosavorus]